MVVWLVIKDRYVGWGFFREWRMWYTNHSSVLYLSFLRRVVEFSFVFFFFFGFPRSKQVPNFFLVAKYLSCYLILTHTNAMNFSFTFIYSFIYFCPSIISLQQSQIYFLSRINVPAKRFGHTLTNQRAKRIDSYFLSRTIFLALFGSWPAE